MGALQSLYFIDMTEQQHPITPPLKLVRQWRDEWIEKSNTNENWVCEYIATQAARWGADMELKACCEFENKHYGEDYAAKLRRYRRPKPKSLADEALLAIEEEQADVALVNYKVIRAALERLQELEGQGQLTKESD